MNENKTDKVRASILQLFRWATLFGLAMWGIQVIGGSVDMTGFLAIYGPLTLGVGIGESANIAKRATANPDVLIMQTEAQIARENGHNENP
jgi:hypothetical protein